MNYQTEKVNFGNAPTQTLAPKEDKAVVSSVELVYKETASLYSIRTRWNGYKWIYVNECENKTIKEIEHEIGLLNDQARVYDKYKDREWINHSYPITKEDIDYYFKFNSKLTKDKNGKPLSEDEIKKLKEEEEFKRVVEDYKIKIQTDYWIILMCILRLVDKPRAQKNWTPFDQKKRK
ncbi:hypothetical protein [Ureaplasma urealyticum]|uniref:hypothetical protein n=1 Tax=Ureaplasma urealyticum TaxID=2130 RepID=UPI00017490DB|nr:hypothetical protein [Ureaplasma urealyticum]EDU56632.1 hypothetical protein UUR7_0420 [Ureaplasma urealyticum serovar 7 str. ATCC 27819]